MESLEARVETHDACSKQNDQGRFRDTREGRRKRQRDQGPFDLGPPEAQPETRIWWQVVYWKDEARKSGEEGDRKGEANIKEHY